MQLTWKSHGGFQVAIQLIGHLLVNGDSINIFFGEAAVMEPWDSPYEYKAWCVSLHLAETIDFTML